MQNEDKVIVTETMDVKETITGFPSLVSKEKREKQKRLFKSDQQILFINRIFAPLNSRIGTLSNWARLILSNSLIGLVRSEQSFSNFSMH